MSFLAPVALLVLGSTVPLTGTIVDPAGRPVAGAMVWLGDTFAKRAGSEVLATARTDEEGRFRLERAGTVVGRGGFWSPTLWAYAPGHRVAFLEFKGDLPGPDEPVRLALGPPATTSLHVLGPDGKPARGARIRVAMIMLKAPRPPDGLLDTLAVTTDADGKATLDGFTLKDLFGVDVTAPGQLVQCLPIDADTGTVALRPLGKLEVRIVADDPKARKGWTVTASSRPTEPGYRGPYTTHWYRDTTSEDGLVAFPPLAVGQVLWEIKGPEGSSYLVPKEPAAFIGSGKTEKVEIKLARAARVEGTVAEEPGGAPVPGVTIDMDALTHFTGRVNRMVTDARGHFSTLVLPGQTRFSFWTHDMPGTHFLPPQIPHWADFEVKEGVERQTFTPPRLRRAAQVRGRVVDEAGKPVPMAYVRGSWISAEFGQYPGSVQTETDAQGEFVLGSIAPQAEVKLSAEINPFARSEPVTVPSAGEGGPVTIVLRKLPMLALTGRVLSADGRPLAGATLHVKLRRIDQAFDSGAEIAFQGIEEVHTDRDGRYRTPQQLPVGQKYRVAAEAAGFEPGETEWAAAPAGQVVDLKLRRAIGTRVVVGRVVDSAGKPVVGAEVFQSGDGPKRTQGTADSDGRFRVTGIPNTPAFLFVSKQGYHFLGRRVDLQEQSVDFTLRRLDEAPAARLQPATSPVSRDDERAIARALLAEARKVQGGAYQTSQPMQIAEITALVDPDRALEMIENQVLGASPQVLTAIAIARFEERPQKAVEILEAIDDPDMQATAALGLFDRLGAEAAPGFRRDLLERTAKRAITIKDPAQGARLLAQVADRRFDLGDAEVASDLARKAAVLLKKPRQQPFPYPNNDIVAALARVDLPAALKLMESQKLQPYDLMSIRVAMAQRIAAQDPAAARRLIGLLEEANRPYARRTTCFRMAATNLPAARALASEDHDPMVEALLPAIAAKELASSDRDGARTLLREAVERLARVPDSQALRSSPAVALARLLPLAVQVDPDRAPDVLWLALSRRLPLPAIADSMPVWTNEVRGQCLDVAELAAQVARYDRSAGEVVLAPVASRIAMLDDESFGLANEGVAIFRAAGAFDARAGRTMLESLPEDPPPPPSTGVITPRPYHQSKAQARLALAGILAMPPALRLRGPFLPADEGWNDDFRVSEGSARRMVTQPTR